ncbi:hypothetical protein BH09PLA1_BH09PLA1_20390 [soil metagenome]
MTRQASRRAIARAVVSEWLERRRLLSSTLDDAGRLLVVGTSSDDVISLGRSLDTLEVFEGGMLSNSFSNALVKAIRIDLLAGNDSGAISDVLIQPATLLGGEGNDRLRGGGGRDLLDGGAGNDILDGGKRGDVFIGGDGKDTADFSRRLAAVSVSLNDLADDGAGEGDNVHGDVETIRGGSGDDLLIGNTRSNRLYGNAGNDTLIGSKGNDSLEGGTGNDSVVGGLGDDSLVGGADDDTFPADAGEDGNDTVQGDAADGSPLPGNDTWDYSARKDAIDLDAIGTFDNTATSGGATDRAFGIETVIAGSGNDSLSVANDSPILLLRAGPGNDSVVMHVDVDGVPTVHGDDGDDAISLSNGFVSSEVHIGNASVYGDAGDDYLYVSFGDGPSNRQWFGGEGTDSVDMQELFFRGNHSTTTMTLNEQADDGTTRAENIHDDVEILIGFSVNMQGNERDNTFIINGGGNTVDARGGNDTIINRSTVNPFGPADPDTIDGGDGIDAVQEDNDQFSNTEIFYSLSAASTRARDIDSAPRGTPTPGSMLSGGTLIITGTSAADSISITQTSALITVYLNKLNPATFSAASVQRLIVRSGAGDDFVNLRSSKGTKPVTRLATIYGEAGNDTLLGGDAGTTRAGDLSGGDLIVGGAGDDSIRGGNGRDYLDGGDQTAKLQTDGNDTLDGGTGSDAVLYYRRTNAVTVNLTAGTADAGGERDRLSRIEDVFSGSGNDNLAGTSGHDFFDGGAGNDTIRPGNGSDNVSGGFGSDLVFTLGDNAVDFVNLSDDAADICHGDADDKIDRDALDQLLNT